MIKTIDPKIPAVAVDGTTPFTPEQIIDHARVIREHVPDFGPLPMPEARALRTTASLPAPFVQAALNTVGASKPIADAITSDVATLQAEAIDVARWSAVEVELRALLEGVAAANLARRHRLGLTALQTYSIARQLVRRKAHADLLPYVEEMRRTNRLGRKRAAQEPQNPANPTSPAPVVPPVKS